MNRFVYPHITHPVAVVGTGITRVRACYDRKFGESDPTGGAWTGVPNGTAVVEWVQESEYHIYGSSRVGVRNAARVLRGGYFTHPGYELNGTFKPYTFNANTYSLPAAAPATVYAFTRGRVRYEITNHLGNVLATISDRKRAFDDNTNGLIDRYAADVWSYSDYYPFGSLMPGRHATLGGDGYRYGFQNQETDDEIYGEGNAVSFEYRVHDPRIGRFFSVDPLTMEYVHYSPYTFSGNRVIDRIELEGLEPVESPRNFSTSYIQGTASQHNGLYGPTLVYAITSHGKNAITVRGKTDQAFWIKEVVNPPGQAGSSYFYADYTHNPKGEWVFFHSDEVSRQHRKAAAIGFQKTTVGLIYGTAATLGGMAAAFELGTVGTASFIGEEIESAIIETATGVPVPSMRALTNFGRNWILRSGPRATVESAKKLGCFIEKTKVVTKLGERMISDVSIEDSIICINQAFFNQPEPAHSEFESTNEVKDSSLPYLWANFRKLERDKTHAIEGSGTTSHEKSLHFSRKSKKILLTSSGPANVVSETNFLEKTTTKPTLK